MATLHHNISGELTKELLAVGDSVNTSKISLTNIHVDTPCTVDLYIEKKLTGNAKEITPDNCEVNIQLYSAEHKYQNKDHIIESYPLSQSWAEGTQRYTSSPSTTSTGSYQPSNGATWVYRTEENTTQWPTSSFGNGATGSYSLKKGGGVWYTGSAFRSEATFLAEDDLDLSLDVTTMIQKFSSSFYQDAAYPTGIPNEGFIVKKLRSVEEDGFGFGYLKYFSSDTHTIYPPKLCFKWDDSTHNKQSSAKQSGELSVSLYRNQELYNQNSEATFRIHVRDKYPVRQFASSSNFLTPGYFTTSSFYSVRDAHTEEEIIPFDDNFTKLSADSDGMYFKIFMNGLQPERYYRILFKHTNNEGTRVYDNNYHFKVVR